MGRKNKRRDSKRYIRINGAEFVGKDARTATEQAFEDRMARIALKRKRESVELREMRVTH